MLTLDCTHDGTASGQSRLHAGQLVYEIACDECGQTLADVDSEPYEPNPKLVTQQA